MVDIAGTSAPFAGHLYCLQASVMDGAGALAPNFAVQASTFINRRGFCRSGSGVIQLGLTKVAATSFQFFSAS